MNKSEKYRASSLANFTRDELKQARENMAFVARRFPEEHALSLSIMDENGLGNHREVIQHFVKYKAPITQRELSLIMAYADSTYAGPYGRGEQRAAPTNGAVSDSAADRLYRPAIKPDGA